MIGEYKSSLVPMDHMKNEQIMVVVQLEQLISIHVISLIVRILSSFFKPTYKFPMQLCLKMFAIGTFTVSCVISYTCQAIKIALQYYQHNIVTILKPYVGFQPL